MVGALAYEPQRDWKYIGGIRSVRTSRDIRTKGGKTVTVYNGVGADFWVTSGTSGQYDYYVATMHSAEVPGEKEFPEGFTVAVREVRERVRVLNPKNAFMGYGNFRPDGSGSSSQSVVTWGVSLGVDGSGRPLPAAQAGFSESHTTGLTFKWYTHVIDPNSEIQFEFYDLKKRGWLLSSPAWGQVFVARPVVLVHVDPRIPFHEGDVRVKAEVDFVYGESARVCGIRYGGCVRTYEEHTVSAPPVEFTVEMYPWFVNRK